MPAAPQSGDGHKPSGKRGSSTVGRLRVGQACPSSARAAQLQGCPSQPEPPGNCHTQERCQLHTPKLKACQVLLPKALITGCFGDFGKCQGPAVCLVAPARRGWGRRATGNKHGILHGTAGLPELCHNGKSLGTLPSGPHLLGAEHLACCTVRFRTTRNNSGQDTSARSRLGKHDGGRFIKLRRRQCCPRLLPSSFPAGSCSMGERWARQTGRMQLP